jgi:hypothetical protein
MADGDKELMMAALRQLDGSMNFKILAQDLGMNSANSANKRWSRFKVKLHRGNPTASATTSPVKMQSSPAKSPKRNADTLNQKTSAKKRRINSSDEEEEEDDLEVKEEPNGDAVDPRTAFTTPPRRLPARSARVRTFKEATSDEEEPEDEDFADSGHGGTPDGGSDARMSQSDDEA